MTSKLCHQKSDTLCDVSILLSFLVSTFFLTNYASVTVEDHRGESFPKGQKSVKITK